MRAVISLFLWLAGVVQASYAASVPEQGRDGIEVGAVLSPRDRVEPENRMLRERLDTLLPRLMKDADLDMWVVIAREYAEDPVYFTLVPQPAHAARRTTMLVFHRQPDGSVQRLSINRYPFGAPYETAWSGGDLKAQWDALGALIAARDPRRIGINVSGEWAVADGLTHALHERLLSVLPAALHKRLVPAEALVVRWMETRTPGELAAYPHIVSLARGVVAEAFSGRVITPGVTTTDDMAWYIRERFESLGLSPWFMPDVNLQRAGTACADDAPFCGEEGVIQPGDVLHTDVGLCYLHGLCHRGQREGACPGVGRAERAGQAGADGGVRRPQGGLSGGAADRLARGAVTRRTRGR